MNEHDTYVKLNEVAEELRKYNVNVNVEFPETLMGSRDHDVWFNAGFANTTLGINFYDDEQYTLEGAVAESHYTIDDDVNVIVAWILGTIGTQSPY